jgi:hypothetical protein
VALTTMKVKTLLLPEAHPNSAPLMRTPEVHPLNISSRHCCGIHQTAGLSIICHLNTFTQQPFLPRISTISPGGLMVPPSLMIPPSVHRCHLQGDGNRVVRAKMGFREIIHISLVGDRSLCPCNGLVRNFMPAHEQIEQPAPSLALLPRFSLALLSSLYSFMQQYTLIHVALRNSIVLVQLRILATVSRRVVSSLSHR